MYKPGDTVSRTHFSPFVLTGGDLEITSDSLSLMYVCRVVTGNLSIADAMSDSTLAFQRIIDDNGGEIMLRNLYLNSLNYIPPPPRPMPIMPLRDDFPPPQGGESASAYPGSG